MLTTSGLSRRTFLIGSAGLVGLAACKSSGSNDNAGGTTTTSPTATGGKVLIANFAYQGSYAVTGHPQRLVFLIGTPDGAPARSGTPDKLEFTLSRDGQPVGGPISVERHTDGVPLPFYPLRTTFTDPGTYKATTSIDGNGAGAAFVVSDPSQVSLLQPGQKMKPVDTPTPDDHRGVEPICTRVPECPLHTPTLTQALASGKPIALLVGTPAYCQTGICGPVLDLLIEQQAAHPDVTFLHAEVYKNAAATGNISTASTTPIIDAYGLTYEPALFFAGADGTITERLDNAWDRTEIAAGLDRITR